MTIHVTAAQFAVLVRALSLAALLVVAFIASRRTR